jgi:hypothetical protein
MTNTSRQPNLFDGEEFQAPDPERLAALALQRMTTLLDEIRAADSMPWDAQRAEVNALVFHNMANWLPAPERNALRAAFRTEMERLDATHRPNLNPSAIAQKPPP